MYFTIDNDISDIDKKHEKAIKEEEQSNSEKLFMEGLNSEELPSQKQKREFEPLTF